MLTPDEAVERLLEIEKLPEAAVQSALLELLDSQHAYNTSTRIFDALGKTRFTPELLSHLDRYFHTNNPFSHDAQDVIAKQHPSDRQTLIDDLLNDKLSRRRVMGLDLLLRLWDMGQSREWVRSRIREFLAARPSLPHHEKWRANKLLAATRTEEELASELTKSPFDGLASPPAPVQNPQDRNVQLVTPACLECMRSLDKLVDELMPSGKLKLIPGLQDRSITEQWSRFPISDEVEEWLQNRPPRCRDDDGFELLRAGFFPSYPQINSSWKVWVEEAPERAALKPFTLLYHPKLELANYSKVWDLIRWLCPRTAEARKTDFFLDVVESVFAAIPDSEIESLRAISSRSSAWHAKKVCEVLGYWLRDFEQYRKRLASGLTPTQIRRYWNLLHWLDETLPGYPRQRNDLDLLLSAFQHGAATDGDVLEKLVSKTGDDNALWRATSTLWLEDNRLLCGDRANEYDALLDRLRERIVESEINRDSDAPIETTELAQQISTLFGLDILLRLLGHLDKKGFRAIDSANHKVKDSRAGALTQLIRNVLPKPNETDEAFAEGMRDLIQRKKCPRSVCWNWVSLLPSGCVTLKTSSVGRGFARQFIGS